MDIPPSGGHNDISGTALGGDLHIPPPEHVCTVHCNQSHNGPVSDGGAETGANDIQAVVGTGRVRCGRCTDDGFGGGTY